MSRPSSLASQKTAEYLKSINASHYSPRKAAFAVHVTHHTVNDGGLSSPQPRSRVHEKSSPEMNDQQPQEPFYAHETWSSAAVVAGRPRDDDQRTNPLLDHLRKQQKQYAAGFQPGRGDRSRRKSSDRASTASSRKEVRFKLASVVEDEEPEAKPVERPRQQRSKTSPSRIETVNGKSEHTKSEHIKLEHSKSEHSKAEHSKAEHSKAEHSESPRKKKSKHPREAASSESSSSPSKSSSSGYTIPSTIPTLPEIAPLEPLFMPSLQPTDYDTPSFMATSRLAPIHARLPKGAPMESLYRMPVQPPQYPSTAASFHSGPGRRRQAGLGGARDEFVPIFRSPTDHRAYVAFGSEPARFTDTYHWRDNMTYVMGQQSFYAGTGRE